MLSVSNRSINPNSLLTWAGLHQLVNKRLPSSWKNHQITINYESNQIQCKYIYYHEIYDLTIYQIFSWIKLETAVDNRVNQRREEVLNTGRWLAVYHQAPPTQRINKRALFLSNQKEVNMQQTSLLFQWWFIQIYCACAATFHSLFWLTTHRFNHHPINLFH